MIRALALIAATAAPASAQFCTDNVTDLPLTPTMLSADAQLVIQDQGMAQIISINNGLSQIEIFIGSGNPSEEAALRSGQSSAAALQAECRAQVPDCISDVLITPDYAGTARHYSSAGMAQSQIRIYAADQSATVRVTLSGGTPPEADQIARRTLRTILPALSQC